MFRGGLSSLDVMEEISTFLSVMADAASAGLGSSSKLGDDMAR